MNKVLLQRYLRLAIAEAHSARVPQQLLQPNGNETEEKEEEEGNEQVKEFSGVGAVAGFTAPLGAGSNVDGRNKGRPRKKKN